MSHELNLSFGGDYLKSRRFAYRKFRMNEKQGLSRIDGLDLSQKARSGLLSVGQGSIESKGNQKSKEIAAFFMWMKRIICLDEFLKGSPIDSFTNIVKLSS